jgi:iron complex transport system substrate-binding protein
MIRITAGFVDNRRNLSMHVASIDNQVDINKPVRSAQWRKSIGVLFVASALILAACASQAAEPAGPVQIMDGLDREITLEGPAQRIVSLAPSNTEILFAVGAGSQVIGRDDISDFPADASNVTSIGSTFGELNTEAILALEPDLVLAATITAPEQLQTLESLGLTTFVLANPMNFEELYENLATAGLLTGHSEEAADLADELRARVEAVTTATAGAAPASVFYEVDGSDSSAPWTTGAGTFQDLLIDLAGGANVASGIQGWGQIDLEALVTSDPEVIMFGEGPFIATTIETLAVRPGWDGISAVQMGRVVPIDTNLVDRPGPRLVDALEAIAEALHPELFD